MDDEDLHYDYINSQGKRVYIAYTNGQPFEWVEDDNKSKIDLTKNGNCLDCILLDCGYVGYCNKCNKIRRRKMEDENILINRILKLMEKRLAEIDKERQAKIDADYDKMNVNGLKAKVKELEGTVNDLKLRIGKIEYARDLDKSLYGSPLNIFNK